MPNKSLNSLNLTVLTHLGRDLVDPNQMRQNFFLEPFIPRPAFNLHFGLKLAAAAATARDIISYCVVNMRETGVGCGRRVRSGRVRNASAFSIA